MRAPSSWHPHMRNVTSGRLRLMQVVDDHAEALRPRIARRNGARNNRKTSRELIGRVISVSCDLVRGESHAEFVRRAGFGRNASHPAATCCLEIPMQHT